MSHKKYYYRADLDIPSFQVEFIEQNAKKMNGEPYQDEKEYWIFKLGLFKVRFCSPKEFNDLEVQPFHALITVEPLEEDNVKVNLALFLKHILMLCEGLYIDMIAAERVEVRSTSNPHYR